MRNIYCIFILLILLIRTESIRTCSIITVKQGDKVLAGRNYDGLDMNLIMGIVLPADGKYGYIYHGNSGPYEGMNDQGLFFGLTALTSRNDINYPSTCTY